MTEIKTPLEWDAIRCEWIIGENHTINDILRFVVSQSGNSISEIEHFVDEWKKEHG